MSQLEEALALQLDAAKIPYERQYRAIPARRFTWDFYFKPNLLLEVQGGIWHRGGHSTGTGITRDAEKNNLATLAGFRSLMVTSEHIKSGKALAWIIEALL